MPRDGRPGNGGALLFPARTTAAGSDVPDVASLAFRNIIGPPTVDVGASGKTATCSVSELYVVSRDATFSEAPPFNNPTTGAAMPLAAIIPVVCSLPPIPVISALIDVVAIAVVPDPGIGVDIALIEFGRVPGVADV